MYGARPLRRMIQSMVEDQFSEAMLDGIVHAGGRAIVDAEDDKIVIRGMNPHHNCLSSPKQANRLPLHQAMRRQHRQAVNPDESGDFVSPGPGPMPGLFQ